MKLPRRGLVIYGSALLGVGLASAIRYALDPVLGEHMLYAVYFLAVFFGAWAGGVKPAIITALLSSLLANYLFTEPRGHFHIANAEQLCSLIVFNAVSLLIGVLCEISLRSTARARAAEQQKDDFLAILAHELRNPLAIIHYTNLAEQRDNHVGSHDRSEVIDRQVQHLDQMIDDLADIARVSRGKFQMEFEPAGVAGIVEDALDVARRYFKERDHELVVSRAPEDMILWCDSLRIQQVITNLLRNAARFTPRGGRIEFRVSNESGSAVFRLRDNGQGIPKEMLSRVFDLHTQVERSLDQTGSGLGIGLALVRTLVELHGGSVAAMSDGPNRGSEFVVRLPLYREPSKPT
ncbi:MAG TPA: HAMP domain-containing sensor histidine kinase [Lacipirellulaceae bacterium]|jgi:K+-sensing histidine kinase KdpD|nr:HAMP domain-containing sensor histidine kinase [Lacipirellulaceae bacterium]